MASKGRSDKGIEVGVGVGGWVARVVSVGVGVTVSITGRGVRVAVGEGVTMAAVGWSVGEGVGVGGGAKLWQAVSSKPRIKIGENNLVTIFYLRKALLIIVPLSARYA